jgi:hypothetical protein
MNTFYAAFAILAMAALFASSSQAGLVRVSADRIATENFVILISDDDEPVSDRCRRDDHGWHFMSGERRAKCRPTHPREGDANTWGWRCEGQRCGWWHQHERRWHDRD